MPPRPKYLYVRRASELSETLRNDEPSPADMAAVQKGELTVVRLADLRTFGADGSWHEVLRIVPAKPLSPSSFDPEASPLEKLRVAGLRATRPRVLLLKALEASREPLSIEALHSACGGMCDLVSVYRTMEVLETLGLAKRLFMGSGTFTFSKQTADEAVFLCAQGRCATVPLPPEQAKGLRSAIAKVKECLASRGYTGVTCLVEFFDCGAPTIGSAVPRNRPTRGDM